MLSQIETARIMTERGYPMSRTTVQDLERKALQKLRRHPLLADLADQLGIQTEKESERE